MRRLMGEDDHASSPKVLLILISVNWTVVVDATARTNRAERECGAEMNGKDEAPDRHARWPGWKTKAVISCPAGTQRKHWHMKKILELIPPRRNSEKIFIPCTASEEETIANG